MAIRTWKRNRKQMGICCMVLAHAPNPSSPSLSRAWLRKANLPGPSQYARLPQLGTASETVNEYCNLIYLLAHRLGLAGAFHLAFQGEDDHIIGEKDFWTYLPKLKPVSSFREKWLYNSHGYSIVGEMIKKVTGKSVNECLQDEVCQPLGLTRTTTQLDFDTTPNFAKPYSALSDGTPFLLKSRQDFRNHFFEVAAGVYTTPNDAAKLAKALLSAFSGAGADTESNIKESETIFTQHIPVMNPSQRERSYACGWIRTQLPGITGVMGDNIRILPASELPEIGEALASKLVVYHQGATVGYFPSFYLFPETESAVLVFTNSIALGDTADWIAQAVTQALFDDKKKVDWVSLTKKTTSVLLEKYRDMAKAIESERAPDSMSHNLSDYTGKYYDDTGIFFIQVEAKSDSKEELIMSFQGLEKHSFELRHLHDDVFEWALTRNQTAKRARYHQFDPEYFKMHFGGSERISKLTWQHDPNLGPETFGKRNH